jgi:serine protease Do
MGNPRGLSSSMTLGIVANTKRVFMNAGGGGIQEMRLDEGEATGLLTRWIQHDALIQPGNSGGPLVNLAGEVIGINEIGGTGMGFAIPSNLAAIVMQQALAKGEIRRGWLGLGLMPVEKMGREDGVLVASVLKGSPAEKAGVKAGDVVLAIDTEPVRALFYEQIPLVYQRIANLVPGRKAKLVVLRDGSNHELAVDVALMEESLGHEMAVPAWGVTVRGITGPMALARRYPSTDGVLITGTRAGKPAEDAKPPLPAGAVVLEIGGKPVTDAESFLKLVEEHDGKETVLVRYRRGAQDLLTSLDTSEKPEPRRGRELPKAWIGVRTQVLTTDVAKALGLEKTRGFRITEVFPGTQAERAGLRTGDIVTAIDGDKLRAHRLQDAEMWRRKVETLTIDTEAELSVLRGEEKLDLSVLLEETPTSSVQAKTHRDDTFEFGVREITFSDTISRRWEKGVSGVVVTSVTPGGWASLGGLQGGDLIRRVQGEAVSDLASFKKVFAAVKNAKPKRIRLFVQRGFQTSFVFIEPDWE